MAIRVSERHGVNPMIPVCFFCNKMKNEVALLGRLPGDAEAPHRAVLNKEPCEECQGYMDMGVIIVSVKDSDEGEDNPYRTGGWWVVKDEFVERLFGEESPALKTRFAFITDSAVEKIGLNTPEEEDDANG